MSLRTTLLLTTLGLAPLMSGCKGDDGDGDGYEASDDCDDEDPQVNPGVLDLAGDGEDANCDGVDGHDGDGDGVASEWSGGDDCDDEDDTTYPGADIGCDGGDHDCDGDIDNDDDGDGFWDKACGGEDCDDDDAMVNPASTEVCDGIDNDCDGTVDNDEHVLGDDPECYAYSCKDIDDARSGLDDGSYYIDPTDSGSPFEVHCDMHTDGGGYTFLKVDYGSTAYAVDAESHCDGYGMQLFIPRTNNHLVAAYDIAYDASIGPSAANYLYIMGIYPNYYRATCTNRALKSGSSGCNWSASDGRAFWVTNRTNISEPNGDNGTTSSMYYSFHSDGSIDWYNDIPYPGYGSRYFMCDVGDKY